MCNKLTIEERHVPDVGVKMGKTLVVIVLFCLSECTAGSCLKYGHSCWGGHGKRNDGTINHISESDPPNGDLPNDMKWFLQKLLQANDYTSSKGRDVVFRNLQLLLKEVPNDDDRKSNEDSESTEDQQDGVIDLMRMFPDKGDKASKLKEAERNFFKFLRNN